MHSKANILPDPEWFPHRIDATTGSIRFLHLTRDAHRAAAFLADEYLGDVSERVDLADADTREFSRAAAGPAHFIFHSAFCCSTLLARVLDVPGRSMGLKEPAILNDLAAAQRSGVPAPRLRELLDRALWLLSRPFGSGEATIIKPGNVANGLIEPCLDVRPGARVVLMYSRLPVFLRSVASKGLWGRHWARKLYQHLRPMTRMNPGFDDAEIFGQTDLQIAALAWLMHQSQFADILRKYGPDRVRSLDGDVLIGQPHATLLAISALFELGFTADTVTILARSSAFNENSKSHAAGFDRGVRAAEHASIASAHGEEIDMVVNWADAVARHCGVPLTLDRSLPG